MTPPDHLGDDPVPHAGGGAQGLSTARLTGLLNGTYARRFLHPSAGFLPGVPVVSQNNIGSSESSISGSTGATWVATYKMTTPCTQVQLVFPGWVFASASSPAETATTTPQPIKVSVEINGSGVRHPVAFGTSGLRSGTIDPYGVMISPPMGGVFATGDLLTVRVFQNLASPGKYVVTRAIGAAPGLTAASDGYTLADNADSGGSVTAAAFGAFLPIVVGQPLDPTTKAVFGLGDSIINALGDTNVNYGWLARLVNGTLGMLRYSTSGAMAQQIAGLVRWQAMASSCSHAVVMLGRNDLSASRSLAQIQGDLTTIWTALSNLGLKVYGCTVLPTTTSTDSWATTGNQTAAAYEATRVSLNTWIRTTPAPLAGYFETADLAETARSSGIWKAGYTSDGTHPNATGAAAIASGLSLTTLA